MTPEQERQLTWAYCDGEPTEILARQFHICKRSVERIAKRNGAKLRQQTAREIKDRLSAKHDEKALRE